MKRMQLWHKKQTNRPKEYNREFKNIERLIYDKVMAQSSREKDDHFNV